MLINAKKTLAHDLLTYYNLAVSISTYIYLLLIILSLIFFFIIIIIIIFINVDSFICLFYSSE